MQDGLRGFLLTGSPRFLDPYHAGTQRDRPRSWLSLRKSVSHNPEWINSLDEIKRFIDAWNENVAVPAIALRKGMTGAKDLEGLASLVSDGQSKGYLDGFRSQINTLVKKNEAVLADLRDSARKNHVTTQRCLLAAVCLWVIWNFWFWYKISRSITEPLAEAAALAEAISNGDLSRSLPPRGTDHIGRLISALNHMVSTLREQTGRTLEAIKVLSSSAGKISGTVAQLAAGATRTTAAVTETTTTFEQVRQSAKVSSEKAKRVAEDSHRAVDISEAGKKATEEALMRMNVIKGQMESIGETVVRLSEHSQAIEVIVNAVQDIAEQSNLLAVNASIEAARAGDQGKGFAVVALEIKTLADQSKNATDQVRAILLETRKWISAVVMATEQGGKAVEAGVHQSGVAGEAIQVLSTSVALSSQAATVIGTSTEQQFVGLDQVAGGMASIEEAMRQNLDGTLELEQAARGLQDLAGSLKELVQRYRV